MNISNNQAPGISKIYFVKCADLTANLMHKKRLGMPISIMAEKTEIQFCGTATLSVVGTWTNGAMQEKATLKFATTQVLPLDEHIAFLILCANGDKKIIGTKEPKYPVVSYTDTTGKIGGDANLRTYEINHIALKTALECVF
jgi:hypothetical protein